MTRTRTAPWDYEHRRSLISDTLTLIEIECCPHCGANKYHRGKGSADGRSECSRCHVTDISVEWPPSHELGLQELIADAVVNWRAHALKQRELELCELCVSVADMNLVRARVDERALSAQHRELCARNERKEAQIVAFRLSCAVMNVTYFEYRLAMETNKLLGAYLEYVKD